MTETTKLHRVDRGATDVIETGTWWDHGDIDEDGGHTTGRGRVYGVLPVRYEDCIRYGCRSVAVIDPEDPYQVDRFRSLLASRPLTQNVPLAAMQAALREFADPKPPKPDEPTGLGAVVEDAEGCLFVRTNVGGWEWHEGGGGPTSWNLIDAVKVLSDGIPA